MSGILKTSSLDVGYEKKTVIEDVRIEAMRGQTICLIGPNGAGKSTILRTLSGMLSPVKGAVYIGEGEVGKIKPSSLARTMAVVLTEKLNVNMTTAYEIVAMGRIPHTGFFGRLSENDHEVVRTCIHTVGADALSGRDFVSLSDGEKQKILIARALAQEPELIILDEPTSHLDIKHKIEVVRILNRLAAERGLTVILALHDVDIAVKSFQFVLLVKDGKIMVQGHPEDVIRPETIGRLYDIHGAAYNSVLGCVEICNDCPSEAFVLGGAGTAAPIYRMLTRMEIGMATGILHKNDIDYAVAESMGLNIVAQESFQPIGRQEKEEAFGLIDRSCFVVDTGFPTGEFNRANRELIEYAAAKKIPVLSVRESQDPPLLLPDPSIRRMGSAAALQAEIRRLMKRMKGA